MKSNLGKESVNTLIYLFLRVANGEIENSILEEEIEDWVSSVEKGFYNEDPLFQEVLNAIKVELVEGSFFANNFFDEKLKELLKDYCVDWALEEVIMSTARVAKKEWAEWDTKRRRQQN